MKKFKKATSIALAAAMMSAMAFPSMAATITIDKAVEGETYSAYKIFDYKDNGSGGYTYTMDADTFAIWGEYIDNWKYDSDGDGTEDLDVFNYTARTENDVTTYYFTANETFKNNNSDIVKAFGRYLQKKEDKGTAEDTIAQAKGDETDVLTVDGKGYYFIDTTVGTLVNLTNVDDTIEIKEKTVLPEVTAKKMVDAEGNEITFSSNAVGEVVKFKITVNVPEGNNAEIVIHDNMGSGLALKTDSIKLNNTAVTTEETKAFYYQEGTEEADACDFEVVLTEDYVKGLSADDRTLTLTYEATVTAEISDDGESGKNEAWTTYHETTIPGEETKVYAADFAIKKVIADTSTYLAGAKFRLYSDANGEHEVYLTHESNSTVWVVDASEDAVQGDPITTNGEGNVTIKGLKDGEYWLKEVEAPAGYNLLTDMIRLDIADFDDNEATENDGKLSVWDTDKGAFELTADNVVTVENSAGAQLPSTGGIGTTVFYAAGIILMAGAVFFVVRRKRA